MAKMIYTLYQTNNFKIIKYAFGTYELPHVPVIFPVNFGIFNCTPPHRGRGQNANWGGVHSHIHALHDIFLFKLINVNLIRKEIRRAEHEHPNIHPPPLPINVPATAPVGGGAIEYLVI